MILYEYEGKKLLADAGIKIPRAELVESKDQDITFSGPAVLKAQVLSGKRADAGGIIIVDTKLGAVNSIKELFGKTINKEQVGKILVEELVDFESEYYLSISYDTEIRGPVLSISQSGGTGIEERGAKTYPIDPTRPEKNLISIAKEYGLKMDLLNKLIVLFFEQDMLLLEINPLVKVDDDKWYALDAKVKLDDTASGRHKDDPSTSSLRGDDSTELAEVSVEPGQGWNFPPRAVPGHTSTQRELEAKKIDDGDYRGTAGSTYFDLEGDIAILASGGGASITAMDALTKVGGKPANYTEYSGNPPKEKVEKLTTIVLSKPGLNGLWIVGALANFTDIYETLSGFIDGLRQVEKNLGKKLDFPIVIRRAGPNDKKAFEMLREVKDFDLHLYGEETSISESAKVIAKLAKEYKERKKRE
ncbi:hypothetical protein HYS97_00780 [Candidatus Daviesbacteria bacterium]|nr:hypothetical protein [Candidatus Daviesbacteria bacterium]